MVDDPPQDAAEPVSDAGDEHSAPPTHAGVPSALARPGARVSELGGLHPDDVSTGGTRADGQGATIDDSVPEARYAIGEEIASGGAGRVLRAHDRRLQREVALKELRHDHETLRARFQREARITARLTHPGIVPVHDVGTWSSGLPFYAMKLVDGVSLAEATRACASFAERSRLVAHVIDVAHAMAYAHSQRVIHRDLKPLNVLVGPFGETVIIDWGLAKELDGTELADEEAETAADLAVALADSNPPEPEFATHTGVVIGTPGYMPPEQAVGESVDERADVYALGALLYQVLAGRAPYADVPRAERLDAVAAGPPQPLLELAPDAARDLVAIVDKAMARDLGQRYRTAAELADELDRYAAGRVVDAHDYSLTELLTRFLRRHRAVVSTATLGLLALLIVGVWAFASIARQRNRAEDAARAEAAAREQAESSLLAEAQARRDAEAAAVAADEARDQAETRADELTVERARTLLERDPTLAVAWLKTIERQVAGAPSVAAEAAERGVAVRVLREHDDIVSRIVSDPTGRRVASAGFDGRIVVHELDSGATRRLEGHRDRVVDLAFLPDGEQLVSASFDGTLRVWNLRDGTSRALRGHDGPIHDLDVSTDGRLVASIGADDRTRVWHLDDRDRSDQFETPTTRERFVLFSPNGRRLVTGSHGNRIFVHHLASGTSSSLVGHGARVSSVAFSPDGHTLASGSIDGSVWFWNLTLGTGAELARLPRSESGEGRVLVAFSGDGRWFAWSSGSGIVELRNLFTGEIRTLTRHADRVSSLRFSPDSERLLTGGWDNTVRVSDLDTGVEHILRGHDDVVGSLAAVPDGSVVASGSWDKTVRIWQLPDERRRLFRGHGGAINAVVMAEDGARVMSASDDGTVREWAVERGASRIVTTHTDRVSRLALSGDGRWLASAGDDLSIHLVSRADGSVLELRGHEGDIEALTFSPDSSLLASASEDATVRVWTLDEPLSPPLVLQGHTHHVTAVAFVESAGKLALVSASRDRTVRRWALDGATRGESREIGRHEDDVWSLAVSPDMETVASVASDGVRIWDLQGGGDPVRIRERLAGARRLRFAANGRFLAVGGGDDGVQVCALDTLACRLLRANTGVVQDLEISADSRLVVTASADNTIRLWDVESGEHRVLLGHSATVFDIALAPDGRTLVSGGGGGLVGYWPVRPPPQASSLGRWLDLLTEVEISPETR